MVALGQSPCTYGEGKEQLARGGSIKLTLGSELQHPPDNRITPNLISKAINPALDQVEREWRADRQHKLDGGPGSGHAALVTVGLRDRDRFYSNGLNFELALATDGFFDNVFHPLHARLLSFPVPSVAALNGHAFVDKAGGMTLALAQDFRVMKGGEGKGRSMMCMNEIEFGANIPPGMSAILKAKVNSAALLRDIYLAQRYYAPDALKAGLIDAVGQTADEVVKIAREMALKVAPRAQTGIWGVMKEEMFKEALEATKREMSAMAMNDDDEAEERLALSAKL